MKPLYPVSRTFIEDPPIAEHGARAIVECYGIDDGYSLVGNHSATRAHVGNCRERVVVGNPRRRRRLENGAASGQWTPDGRHAYAWRSVRHTLIGHAVHHVCSFGWAILHERWLGPTADVHPRARVATAAATAAIACFVDYRLAPKRFQPGFDAQLSRPSILAMYAAFAVGLAIVPRKH